MKGATNNSAISHLYPNLKGSHQCLLKEWRNWDSPKSNVPMSQESHNPHLSAWCWRSLAFSPLILTHCSVSHCLWLIWGLCIPARTPSTMLRRWLWLGAWTQREGVHWYPSSAAQRQARFPPRPISWSQRCPIHRTETPQSSRQTKLAFLSLIQIQMTVLIFLRWWRACWEPLQFPFH